MNHESIFNRCADGLASETEQQALAELLRSDPEARKAYREFMALHAALHWDYVAAAAPSPPPAAQSQTTRPGKFVAFATGALVAAAAGWMILFLTGRMDENNSSPAPATVAAMLANESGAQFAEGRGPKGLRFGPGAYELLQGVVHLRFANGADLTLASPARLDIQDTQHTRLVYGKVRVTAPPSARGFTIATPAADYIDLGTEFGLRVDPQSGTSDLYVFDGQVNVADPRSGNVLSEFVEGESSRYIDGAISAAPAINADEFPTPGAIGFDRWKQYEQAMRQDPGLLAFFPFHRSADELVLANEHSAKTMPDGRIEGARWATGRWPGKDALLFDRDSDFVALDIPGEHPELTIGVWLKVDRFDHVFSAILNSDGYELGGIHFQLTRQGVPRGGVVVNGKFQDQDKVLDPLVPRGSWVHVVSVLSTRTRSQQIYINGVLARERHWQNDEILRPGSCRLGNWLPAVGVAPEHRALRGRVDELAFWSVAKTGPEIRKFFEAGRPGLIGSVE